MVAVFWDGNGEDAGVPSLWSWTGTVWRRQRKWNKTRGSGTKRKKLK